MAWFVRDTAQVIFELIPIHSSHHKTSKKSNGLGERSLQRASRDDQSIFQDCVDNNDKDVTPDKDVSKGANYRKRCGYGCDG